jgi:SpoIID/LytB domain protein
VSVAESCLGYENEDEVVRWYAREDHSNFDFCADDHCQRYQGVTRALNPNVALAVEATRDVVLKYDGKVCDARFSKCCGGVTERFSACWEDVDFDYLRAFRDCADGLRLPQLTTEEGARAWIESVPDSFCSTDDKAVLSQILNGYDRETNDFYRWKVVYSQSELSALVAERSGIDFGTIEDLLPVERGASGRITKLKIVGSEATRSVGKELEIRRWLSRSHLYSSAFVVDKEMDASGDVRFVLKGAGWGHGVGLCQIGAAMMGEKGYTCEQILSFYYPGAMLEKV